RCGPRRRGCGLARGRAGARGDRRGRGSGRRVADPRMTVSPGRTLRTIREQRPLVHQITIYVVMNETANATLALGALPGIAHAREAARRLGVIASVTGPVDHVSDGERVLAVANGHELLAAVTGTGCMSSALTGCFLAAKQQQPLEAAAEALAAFGVAAEDAARDAGGPGTFHANLYDALAALDPETLDERARITDAR